MTVVGYLASWLKAVFFADNIALNAFFFFLGKWVFDLIYFIVEHRLGGIELVQQLLLWSPLSAAATAVAGVLLLFVMRPLLEPAKVWAFIRMTSRDEPASAPMDWLSGSSFSWARSSTLRFFRVLSIEERRRKTGWERFRSPRRAE